MSLTPLEIKPIYPIRLEEAKNYLRSTLNETLEDLNIMGAIIASVEQAESVTGRIILNGIWEYVPEEKQDIYELPIVPVTAVEIYDCSVTPEAKVPETAYGFVPSSVHPRGMPVRATVVPFPTPEKPIIPDEPVLPEEPGTFTEDVEPEPIGDINSGNIKIVMTCGFKIKVKEGEEINPKTRPVLKSINVLDDTNISFTFDRPISDATCLDYTKPVIKTFDAVNDVETIYTVKEIKVDSTGFIIVTVNEDLILDGVTPIIIKAEFFDTLIMDKYLNVYDVLSDTSGTVLMWSDPVLPEPFFKEQIEDLDCPDQIKRWILVRVGTFYQQRTDIALRSGSANNSLFGRNFIDCLLDPYVVVRFT